uniref:Uncharacterized protein MANES_18G053100 n=1 Tax=Rhizophora mucronata TaxID=61149 RepID=A0A2P2JHQ2_RHIMU
MVDGNGEKHVILCRVVLGNVERVQAGSRKYYPSNVNFDNAVDDFVNPRCYVVWSSNMNSHIIPECVLSFKPSNAMQGKCVCLSPSIDWLPFFGAQYW